LLKYLSVGKAHTLANFRRQFAGGLLNQHLGLLYANLAQVESTPWPALRESCSSSARMTYPIGISAIGSVAPQAISPRWIPARPSTDGGGRSAYSPLL